MSNNYSVYKEDKVWKVRRMGADRASSCITKGVAVKVAIQRAFKTKGNIYVFNKKGSIHRFISNKQVSKQFKP